MTTTKHTPGPWAATARKGGLKTDIREAGHQFQGVRLIASAYTKEISDGTCEANAALIAAAPTMLDELKHAWAVFNAQDSAYMHGQAGSIARLIAKTTGEPWGHYNPDGSYRDFEAAVEAKRLSK